MPRAPSAVAASAHVLPSPEHPEISTGLGPSEMIAGPLWSAGRPPQASSESLTPGQDPNSSRTTIPSAAAGCLEAVELLVVLSRTLGRSRAGLASRAWPYAN